MIEYHTLNYLSEKIYSMNDGFDYDDMQYEISSFFASLMRRRRSDDVEEGLQAGGVIYPDKAGFKVSERDGKASHAQSQENVSQYLNGESSFSSEEDIGTVLFRKNDPNLWANIPKKGFTVRIVANKNAFICVFNTYCYQLTEFQLNVIYELFSCIKNAYEEDIIKYPYVTFVTSKEKFVFHEQFNIDEQLEKLNNLLINKRESIKKKTK